MPDLVVLPMSGDSTLISMFRLGHTLEISANQQTLDFDLTSSSRLMVDLAQCVSERLALESPSSVQPAPDTVAPSTAPAATTTNNEASHEPALSSGTGIVITVSGDIITNQHVIDGCKTILVERPGDLPQGANILAEDKDVDLAVVRSTKPIVDAADLARIRLSSPIKMGDAVAVFGFPLAGALSTSGNLTSGTITALAGLEDNSSHVQISAPIQPGNSGGPLLDYKGDVIGMVDSKLNEVAWASKTGDLPQNVNFAIKANVLTNFLDAHSITYGVASENGPTLELPVVGDRAKRFTVFILCSR
jgi:S1-C subfamily serine protease